MEVTMKKSRYLLGGIILCILIAGLLAGCRQKKADISSAVSSVKEIIFFTIGDESEQVVWDALFDNFNAKHPDIHIIKQHIPGEWEDYVMKLTAMIAAGTPPDFSRMGVAYVPQFSSRDQLTELSGYISRDMNMADYNKAVFDQCKIDGKTFGLPVGIYTLNVYYNKTLFDAAGIPYPSTDWNNPWTLDEFLDIARKLTKGSGPTKQYGFYANLHPERTPPFYFSAGGDVFNADHTKVTMDQKPMLDTYKMLQGLINEGIAPDMLLGRTMTNEQLFMSDRLGMIVEGDWMLPSYARNKDFRFGVAPIPKGSAGATSVVFLDQYVLLSGAKNQEESWIAIRYLLEKDAQELKVKYSTTGIPLYQPVIDSMKDQMFTSLTPAEKEVLLNAATHSKAMYFPTNWNEMVLSIQKTTDLMVLNEISVEEGLRTINAELEVLNAQN
jgi:multiple sugar transport system substrate-binding protein